MPEPAPSPETGLRERKKARTRAHIAETARELFAERGFETVTVAEVARAAEVAQATVFNYFPTKEDLFYSRLEAFEDELLAAVRDRARGRSALDAVAEFLVEQQLGRSLAAGDAEATERLRTVTRVITESPALLAREREVFDGYARSLAELLAEEAGRESAGALELTVANALLGMHRALIEYVRRRALAGDSAAAIGDGVRAEAERAVAQLRRGLGGFAVP